MKVALKLLLITTVCGALLWGVNLLTEPIIIKNEQEAQSAAFKQILDFDEFEIIEYNDGGIINTGLVGMLDGELSGHLYVGNRNNVYGNITLMVVIKDSVIQDVLITVMNQTAGFAERVNNETYLSSYKGSIDNIVDIDTKVGATFAATTVKEIITSASIKYQQEVLGKDVEDVKDAPKADFTKAEDGRYEGSALGYGGDIKVAVVVKDKKVIQVKVLEQSESHPTGGELAVNILPDIIVRENSVDVDTIVNNTVSSNALVVAINNAMLNKVSDSTDLIVDVVEPVEKEKLNIADGTYSGESFADAGNNYSANIKVTVTVKDGIITEINILEEDVKGTAFKTALEGMKANILMYNKYDVDTIAGNTVTSNAIIDATKKALVSGGLSTEKVKLNVADGTYNGEAFADAGTRYQANIKVSLDVKDGIITKLDISEEDVKGTAFKAALEPIKEAILKSNSTDVDTVAGNTVTSKAIIEAVDKALKGDTGTVVKPTEKVKLDVADGTYKSQAFADAGTRYQANIKVSLDVKDGIITKLDISEEDVKGTAFKAALEPIKEAILTKNSTDVDTVAGNTVTSKAIIEAVDKALKGDTGEVVEKAKLSVADGTYTGEALADAGSKYSANIKVSVVVKDGFITKLDISEEDVKGTAFKKALEPMKEAIINSNSLTVDTVTGNTVTSEAIINAVKSALGL